MNIVTAAEIKRRGMAAIEDGLRQGPLHIVKRNRPAAVVISEEEYQRLSQGRPALAQGVNAVQWLLKQPGGGIRERGEIDAELQSERDGWVDR